jgi:glycerol kinase
MADFVGAVDQGTTSTRFMIFDHSGNEVGRHQLEHEQILPQAGWVEHNPVEIWERTSAVLQSALNKCNLQASDLVALGVTNQREDGCHKLSRLIGLPLAAKVSQEITPA